MDGRVSYPKRPRAMDGRVSYPKRPRAMDGRVSYPKRPRAMDGRGRVQWRRRESNPRPVMFQHKRLRVYSVNLNLADATPAVRVRRQPAKNFFSPARTRRWNGASRIWRPIGRPFRLGPSLGVA